MYTLTASSYITVVTKIPFGSVLRIFHQLPISSLAAVQHFAFRILAVQHFAFWHVHFQFRKVVTSSTNLHIIPKREVQENSIQNPGCCKSTQFMQEGDDSPLCCTAKHGAQYTDRHAVNKRT
jgi:hypothetical protein